MKERTKKELENKIKELEDSLDGVNLGAALHAGFVWGMAASGNEWAEGLLRLKHPEPEYPEYKLHWMGPLVTENKK